MEEQRKFKNLKSKLDSLNYKLPFTIDSYLLVETLLNDIISLNSSLSRLRLQKNDPEGMRELSERIEQLNREKLRLEDELQRGNDGKESICASNNELRKENKILSQKLMNLQCERRETIDAKSKDYIEKLFADFSYVKKQFEESEENSQKLMYENRCLVDRIKGLESQILILRKDLEVSAMTLKEITVEHRSTTEEHYGLKKLISSYESKTDYYEAELNGLRQESQKSQQYSHSLEQQISSLNKELSKIRNELELSSSTKVRITSQLESFQRQVDILQTENTKLHNLRDDDRMAILELEKSNKELEDGYNEANDKIRVIQRESQGFCETIREKGEEIRNKEIARKGLEKEVKDLKAFVVKYEESQNENKKLRERIEELTAELRRLKENLAEVKGSLKNSEEELRAQRLGFEQANRDGEVLKRRLEEEIRRGEIISRSNMQNEDQLKYTKSQLDDSKSREKSLHKEIEQHQIVTKKIEEKLGYSQKQSDNLQSQLSMLEQENSRLKNLLNDAMARDNSKSIEISRYESITSQNLSDIEDLRRRLIDLDQANKGLSEELKDKHKLLINEQSHVARLSEQIKQLKDFIAALEDTRSEHLKKIEGLQVSESDKESTIKRLKEDLAQLKKEIISSERSINDGFKEREKLLNEIDSYAHEASRRNEELAMTKNNLKRTLSDLEELKLKVNSVQDSEDHYKRSWRDSEIEKSRLTEINLALNLQLDDSKKSCSKHQFQLQEISKEFAYNDNRLKVIDEKHKSLSQERDNLLVRLEDVTKELRVKSESSANFLRERDEFAQKLRVVSDEYEKLLRAYDYLSLDFKKLSGKTVATENMSESLKKQEENYIRKIKDLEEELRKLIRVAEMTEYKRIEAERTSEVLLKDMHSAKSMTRELDLTRDELQRRLNSIETEKSFLETRCRGAESELNSLKSQLEYEKQRSSEMERSISNKESFKRFELEEDRSRSTKSGENMSELYKQIEMYKTEGLKLEVNYMKVLDELNQTKHQLNRAEARVAELEISRR